jgi:hypothetical protein
MLRSLLALFVVLEIALGGAFYFSAKGSTKAAVVPVTTVRRTCHSAGTVQNYPRTVLIGHYETFSVCLKDLPNVILTYTLSFPDGTTPSIKVLSDKTGFSKQRFLIKYTPQGRRDSVGIGVSYLGKTQINTRFAVQNPLFGKQ